MDWQILCTCKSVFPITTPELLMIMKSAVDPKFLISSDWNHQKLQSRCLALSQVKLRSNRTSLFRIMFPRCSRITRPASRSTNRGSSSTCGTPQVRRARGLFDCHVMRGALHRQPPKEHTVISAGASNNIQTVGQKHYQPHGERVRIISWEFCCMLWIHLVLF